MTGANIISKLLNYSELNPKSFSEKIGLIRPQSIYDIQSGKTKNISPNMADKIISVFPEVNRGWLLTGEGEMLKSKSNEPNQNIEDMKTKELIAAFRESREMLAEALDQNSRLIGVIERMQGIDHSATGIRKSPPLVFRSETE